MDPLKIFIVPANVIFHMFYCPRSLSCINNCTQYSPLYVDLQISDFDFDFDYNFIRYERYFPKGSFTKKVEGLFLENTTKRLHFNVAYKSRQQYENIMRDQARCLEFYLVDSPAKLLQLYLEILLRILSEFIYSVSAELIDDK